MSENSQEGMDHESIRALCSAGRDIEASNTEKATFPFMGSDGSMSSSTTVSMAFKTGKPVKTLV